MNTREQDEGVAIRGPFTRWLYEPEIDIYKNVRLFCIVAFGATVIHFVTDWFEEHHFHWLVVVLLRLLEITLFVGDVLVFLIKLLVRFATQVREIFLAVGIDIFAFRKLLTTRKS